VLQGFGVRLEARYKNLTPCTSIAGFSVISKPDTNFLLRRCVGMLRKKRLMGLIFFFVGVGMIIQYMMPGWGFLLAAALIILGFWYVFAR